MSLSSLAGGNERCFFFGSMWTPGTVSSNPFWWFSPWPWLFSSQACAAKSSAEFLKGTRYPSPEFSFPAAFSSLVVCCMNSGYFGLSRLLPLLLQRSLNGFCLSSLLLFHGLITLKAVNWGNYRTHLICFVFRRICPFLRDVQWLENHCLKNFICFFVLGWIVSLVACYSILAEGGD